jgi:hypothetical protein
MSHTLHTCVWVACPSKGRVIACDGPLAPVDPVAVMRHIVPELVPLAISHLISTPAEGGMRQNNYSQVISDTAGFRSLPPCTYIHKAYLGSSALQEWSNSG